MKRSVSTMPRFLFALPLLLLPSPSASQFPSNPRFGWTLSASATDPLVDLVPMTTDIMTVYLWFYCGLEDGVSAAEFSLEGDGGEVVHDFVPSPGVINVGTNTELLLLFSQCRHDLYLAGHFLVQDFSGGINLCLIPSGITGRSVSFNCGVSAESFENATHGISINVDNECGMGEDFFDGLCVPVVPVEQWSWGRIKARYLP